MSPNNALLVPGDTIPVKARRGCAPAVSGFSWESGDATIATVTSRGMQADTSFAVVNAVRPGQVVITARNLADTTDTVALAVTVKDR